MVTSQRQDMKKPYPAYALITATYLGLYGGFVALAQRKGRPLSQSISSLDLVLLGLATLRLSRLAAWDEVTSFLRLPFVQHRPEDKVEGEQQEPRGRGLLRALGGVGGVYHVHRRLDSRRAHLRPLSRPERRAPVPDHNGRRGIGAACRQPSVAPLLGTGQDADVGTR